MFKMPNIRCWQQPVMACLSAAPTETPVCCRSHWAFNSGTRGL